MAPKLAASRVDRIDTEDALCQAIHRRIAPVLRAAGLDDHEIGCRVDGALGRLRVVLTGPSVAASVAQAIGVRVLDAVHADGRTFGSVEVVYDFDGTGGA
jgi:hypothetical protein